MLRSMLILGLALAVAPTLSAQDKPTAEMKAALSGTWTFDQSRSDTMPANPMALLRGGGRGPGRGGSSAGGGGGGGRSGGRSGGGGGGGDVGGGGGGGGSAGGDLGGGGAPPRGGGRQGGANDPKTRQVIAEGRAVQTMIITAGDTLVTIADDAGQIVDWRADGKKRQEAQFEGGVVESQAGWKYGDFFVMRGLPDGVSVKREYKLSKDGKTLEMKVTLQSGSMKGERKLVYTKN